ncbi:MAG: transposase [Rhodobacteraceae bacterium]|nr:transposase [Paracoccaceae bacterium]
MLPGIPRHRNGCFDPIPIAKDRRRFPEVDTRIVSLYARSMTTRESKSQIEAIHGIESIEASPCPNSAIADAGMDAVTAWRNRSLEPCYPTVLMDAIRVDIAGV